MQVAGEILTVNGSLGANYTSPPLYFQQRESAIITATWTGTPTGTISLEYSSDFGHPNPEPNGVGVTHWYPLDPTNTTFSIAGAAGTATWDRWTNVPFWIRIVYVSGSGSGTLTTIQFGAKGG